MHRYQGLLLQSALLIGFTAFTVVRSEEECLTGKTYWCYECESWIDPRCKDPFNWTASPNDLPTTKQCEGCCVKIVRYTGQPNETVRRTCTKNIQINLFMVDHVCMYEGAHTGHMCFCEGDACNGSPTTIRPQMPTIAFFAVLSAFFARHLVAQP